MPEEDIEGRDTGVPESGEGAVDDEEALRRLQEEIGRLSVADHLLLMMQSLSSLAIDRMGLSAESAPRKDLEQARVAIDAYRALLGVLEGKRPVDEINAHRSVLSQLQMAYVGALSPAEAGAPEGS